MVILLLLTQVSYILKIQSISSKATRPIVTKVHIESPRVEGTKFYPNRPCHMIDMHIYGRIFLKIFSRTNRQMALKLGFPWAEGAKLFKWLRCHDEHDPHAHIW